MVKIDTNIKCPVCDTVIDFENIKYAIKEVIVKSVDEAIDDL